MKLPKGIGKRALADVSRKVPCLDQANQITPGQGKGKGKGLRVT